MNSLRTSFRASSRLVNKPQLAPLHTPAFAVVRSFSATPLNMGRVSDPIIKDHEELKSSYDKIMNSDNHATLGEYQNQFVWELARHSISEEIVVYPAMEKHVPNGKEMAEKDRQEHRAVRLTTSVCARTEGTRTDASSRKRRSRRSFTSSRASNPASPSSSRRSRACGTTLDSTSRRRSGMTSPRWRRPSPKPTRRAWPAALSAPRCLCLPGRILRHRTGHLSRPPWVCLPLPWTSSWTCSASSHPNETGHDINHCIVARR